VPPGAAVGTAHREPDLDDPGAVAAVGVPRDRPGVHLAGREPVRHELPEHRCVGLPPDPARARLLGDELAFGHHRALVTAHEVQGHAGVLGDLGGRPPRPDPGLDLARRQAGRVGADLLETGPVAAHGSAQRLVEHDAEPLAVGSLEHDVRAVVVQADECQLSHGTSRIHVPVLRVPPVRARRREAGR